MKPNIHFIPKSLFAVAALALLGSTANAQNATGNGGGGGSIGPAPAAREFSYTATGAYETSSNFGAGGETATAIDQDSVTEVTVSPYLYVYGNFGAFLTVKGWGAGTYTQSDYEYIHIFTNETIGITFAQFNPPIRQDPTKGGDVSPVSTADKVPASMDVALFKGNGLTGSNAAVLGNAIVSSGFQTYDQVNNINTLSATMADSDGHLVLGLKRQISVLKNTLVGTYRNTGQITISRS